jgi:phosphatidylethanolamine/phosphatidyl-N-methylethanolamine N-methyltransferase
MNNQHSVGEPSESPPKPRKKFSTESFWDLHYWIYDFTWAIAQRNSYRTIAAETQKWANCRVLEVGCGKGHIIERFNPRNEYHLIDYSPIMVKATQDKRDELALDHIKTITVQSALDLKFPAQHFDRVICAHVLTVVPDLQKAVAEIHRVIKPGGQLIVSNSYNSLRGRPAELVNAITKRLGWFYNRDTTAALVSGGFRRERILSRDFYEVSLFERTD